jgi:hypothetical protein
MSGVELWDVVARRRLGDSPFWETAREGGVRSVAFSPGGETLAASGNFWGGGVVLWDADLKSWQRLAGQVANRNFTLVEWRQYFLDEPYRATFPDLPIPPEVASHHETRSR